MLTERKDLPKSQSLEPQSFDAALGEWTTDARPHVAQKQSLKFLTYNLWFGEYHWEERIAAVLNLIARHHPHVVGLQEATPRHLARILAKDWVRRDYRVSDVSGETLRPHGVLLLSRVPLSSLALYHLPSEKDRKFLFAELETGCGPVHIGTVHLESSPESTSTRLAQLDRVMPRLHEAQDAVLMGDFNFDTGYEPEQSRVAGSYMDLWQTLQAGFPGYTADSHRNPMRFLHKRQHKRARFDRILVRSRHSSWAPQSVEIIGQEPVSSDLPGVYPSDHFGLVGVIACERHSPRG